MRHTDEEHKNKNNKKEIRMILFFKYINNIILAILKHIYPSVVIILCKFELFLK